MNLNAALHYIAFTHYIEVYLDAASRKIDFRSTDESLQITLGN